MGTAKSVTLIRKDGKLIQKTGGFTESQTRKAKFLGKEPAELSTKELQTPLSFYMEREKRKNAKK